MKRVNDKVDENLKEVKKTRTTRNKSTSKDVQTGLIIDENKTKLDIEKKLVRSVKSKSKVFIEHYGKQLSQDNINEVLIKKLLESDFKGEIKTLNIYYKVEEETAFCVINHGDPIVIKL